MATSTINTVNDLGNLLKVSNKTLEELVDKVNLCIGSSIHDGLLEKKEAVVLNIGIGTLSINLIDMQCKFIPSKDLKAVIRQSIDQKVDPLELQLADALKNKLEAILQETL